MMEYHSFLSQRPLVARLRVKKPYGAGRDKIFLVPGSLVALRRPEVPYLGLLLELMVPLLFAAGRELHEAGRNSMICQPQAV